MRIVIRVFLGSLGGTTSSALLKSYSSRIFFSFFFGSFPSGYQSHFVFAIGINHDQKPSQVIHAERHEYLITHGISIFFSLNTGYRKLVLRQQNQPHAPLGWILL
jgi:hypothetical protein